MAPLAYTGCRQVLLLLVLLFLFASVCFSVASVEPHSGGSSRRRMLELDAEKEDSSSYEPPPLKKKSTKNTTKLIKPSTTTTTTNNNNNNNNHLVSSKNQTKTVKSNNNLSTDKNQTKLANKLTSKAKTTTTNTDLKKLNYSNPNSTLKTTSKANNTKSLDPVKSSAKNKTTKATATKDNTALDQTEPRKKTNTRKQSPPSATGNFPFEQDEVEDDAVLMLSEFKDLPIRFQRTLIPDLERISTTSRAYITKANKEITKGFKPYVGNKYAPTIATLLSCAFVLIPLLLVSLLFNRIKAYFSLQKLLIFIQAYLSIYFSILCLSSLVTGLEPLRFFYSTSRSTYVCLLVLQTLAYVLYLLLLVMYVLLVFSTDCGLGSRFLGLAQTFVGFAVGLHYYMTVFHRVVLRQAPKTNWKVHGIYATCFFVICLVARADGRKKTYLEEGGDEGKKN